MQHIEKFKQQTSLIEKYGEENAYLIWAMSLYLDYPNFNLLASESLTDGAGDKKIDFIRLDIDNNKLIIAQATYSKTGAVYKAKSNKASDLNTALGWILFGDLEKLKESKEDSLASLREIISDFREALAAGDIEEIDIIYVHNLAESQNVADELEIVKKYLESSIQSGLADSIKEININAKELGIENIERLFKLKEASIVIEDKIILPQKLNYTEASEKWTAAVFTVSGQWLKKLYEEYADSLFSANYRGFLGINKKRKINSGIKNTVESVPQNFWAYNNGITILTTKFYVNPDNEQETILEGISIINGAQTTGSIAHAGNASGVDKIKVLVRVVGCGDEETIKEIVKYNNTQNAIKTWDQYSGNPEQLRIVQEFKVLGYEYSTKRGFSSTATGLSIEQVAQFTLSLRGNYADSSRGKNSLFENDKLYKDTFQDTKSKHILLAFCIAGAINKRREELKAKYTNSPTKDEVNQLSMMRHLKFKQFLISVIGDCMENIVGESVDKHQIAFANGVAGVRHNSLEELIDKCIPIVTMTLRFIVINIPSMNKEFNDVYYNKEDYNSLIDRVKNAIDGMKLSLGEDNLFSKFSNYIAPQG